MGLVIMGGEFRGRRLATDPDSKHIRPTSGKVREALFSSLGERVPGSRFVDLFAGTGAVGLEALSRGAAEVHLVENHPRSWALLKANCESVAGKSPMSLHLERASAAAFCKRMAEAGKTFDIVFVDPPFQDDFSGLPRMIIPILAPDGTAVVQYPSRTPPGWVGTAAKIRTYGESGLAFLPAANPGDAGRSIF